MGRIEVVLGDTARQDLDAVVTVADEPDGACAPGEALAAPASDLAPVRYVIHTVGPVWEGGDHGEARVLASCYQRSLLLAEELGVRSVAFPAIATGIYGFPPELAAEVATTAVRSIPVELELIRLVAFDQETYDLLTAALAQPITERCPTCGADAVPVLIGRPTQAARAARRAGLLRLAGCYRRGDGKDPQWECSAKPKHRWTSGDEHDVRWLAAVQQAIQQAES